MNRIKFALIALMAFAGAVAYSADETAAAHNKIQNLYNQFCNAINSGNYNGAWSFVDKSCVMVDQDGKIQTAAQAKKEMDSMVKMMKNPRCSIKVNHVEVNGPEVVAWGSMTSSCMMKQGNKWVPMSFTQQFAETWRNMGGKWKIVYCQMFPM